MSSEALEVGWPWGQPRVVAAWIWAAAGDSGPSCAFPPAGSTLTCGNVLYLLLFGWWLSLLYILVAAAMFVTIMGAPYGEFQIWDPHARAGGAQDCTEECWGLLGPFSVECPWSWKGH